MLEITRTSFSEVGSLEKSTPATRAMQTCLLVWAMLGATRSSVLDRQLTAHRVAPITKEGISPNDQKGKAKRFDNG